MITPKRRSPIQKRQWPLRKIDLGESVGSIFHMRIQLKDVEKTAQLCALFRGLKQFSDSIVLNLSPGGIDMQCLDSGCCCLLVCRLEKTWFEIYEFDQENDEPVLGFHSRTLHKVLGTRQEGQTIEITGSREQDTVGFSFKREAQATAYDKFFQVPLISVDQEQLVPDERESEVDLVLPTRRFVEVIGQLALFDTAVTADFTEDGIEFVATGPDGSMRVELALSDVDEYAIGDGHHVQESYSLSYLQSVGTFGRLSDEIKIGVSAERPLEATYSLGDGSYTTFFLAPRIKDT